MANGAHVFFNRLVQRGADSNQHTNLLPTSFVMFHRRTRILE